MKAENEKQIEPAITREQVRAGIAQSAAAIGCDKKRAVSGTELLIIFIRELARQGILPPTYDKTRAMQVAGHFDANSSAMTKRLYESEGGEKVDKIAALAAMLSA